SLAWESTGCGGMQVPGRAFLGGAGAAGRRRCSCGVLAAFGRLQSEVGAMAVKGDIIPRGV
ncbi:MAG: hypothetical protein ACN6OP_28400, partial [Pseudomonadales bacterium]